MKSHLSVDCVILVTKPGERREQASLIRRSCLLLSIVVVCLLAYAYEQAFAADFPGRGSKSLWMEANKQYNEGIDLDKRRLFNEAIGKFQAAIRIYPYDSDFHNYLGVDYMKKGDLKSAEAAYRESIRLKENDWRSWSNLVSVLFFTKQYQKARVACDRSLRLNPPEPDRERLENALKVLDKKIQSAAP